MASQVRRWLWILQKQPEKGYLKQHELLHDRPARSVKLGIPICVWRTGIRKGTAPVSGPSRTKVSNCGPRPSPLTGSSGPGPGG